MTSQSTYSLCSQIIQRCTQRQLTVTCAESCTGGGLSQCLTSISGSSHVFHYGFITYSNGAKTDLLNVPDALLNQYGAVSAPVAKAMAQGALLRAEADIAISITGIAGPKGATQNKPVGMVWIGLAQQSKEIFARQLQLTGGRTHIRQRSIQCALGWLLETVCSE